MKKTYRLEELDCANCALKMEQTIAKLEGVRSVTVSFIAQKLTLEADDDIFEDALKNAARAIKKIEPDCKVII